MARIILELSDDPVVQNGVRLTIGHDPFETHDADGNELPETPAMKAAMGLVAHYQTMGTPSLASRLDVYEDTANASGN